MIESSPARHGRKRFATIDIGTNSVLMLVVEAVGSDLHRVVDRAVITRLGRGVDRAGHLEAEASRRTLECLQSYADELKQLQVSNCHAVGTSALRDAAGGDEFLNHAERILGTRPRVLTGQQEADLSFGGALSGLNFAGKATVFDVGGGSTEIISGDASDGSVRIADAISLNIGAVRLHERHVSHDPPLPEELRAVKQDVRKHLPDSARYGGSPLVVGVAGTVTTLFAVSKKLQHYQGDQVHGQRLSREEIANWTSVLGAMSLAERCNVPGLDPRRADVVVTGAVVVGEVMDWLQANAIIVSDRGLRWGLAEQLAWCTDS